jgi:hypothetical protein
MGSIFFGSGIDTAGLQADAERIKRIFKSIGASAEREGSRIDNVFKNIGMAAAGVFTIQAATGFISKIAQVRGEFQQLEVAFTTILRSKDKADKLMAEAVKLAAITPFTLQDVATGAKQLLAYGFSADSITKNLTMLGNVASGVSAPLGDIVYLYGTLQTQGRAYTRDIMQFTSRGIPMIDELSKVMGVSKDKIQELTEAGKVGFPQVQQAMQNLTKEGGVFFNLMEEQSKTITGKISNLQDAFSRMFNDIGKSNQGAIAGALDTTIDLVNNYQEVGKTIGELIAVYGVYKVSLMSMSAAQTIQTTTGVYDIATKKLQVAATIEATAAQYGLNKAVLVKPYVLAAAAVAALAYGIYKYATYTTDAEKAQKKLEEATTDYNASLLTEQVQIETLFAKLKNAKKGTEEYDQAKSAIMNKYGTYLKGLGDETTALNDVALAYKTITEEATKASKARAMQGFADQAAQDYGKTMSGLMDDLKKEVEKKYSDPKQAAKVMVALTPVLAGNEKRKTLNPIISKFDVIGGGEMTGLNLNPIIDLIEQSGEARKILNGVISDATAIFGEAPKEAVKGTTEVIKDYNTQLKEAQTNLKSLKQKQSDLESHKIVSKDYDADKTANKKELDAAQAKVDNLLNKASSQETKAADSQAKAAEESLKADLEFQKRKEELVYKSQQDYINMMADGAEKTRAQAKLDHEKRMSDIAVQEAEWLKRMQDDAQREYEAKGGKGKADVSKVTLPASVRSQMEVQKQGSQDVYDLTLAKTNFDKYYRFIKQNADEKKKLTDASNEYEIQAQAKAIREMAQLGIADLSEYMKRAKAKIDLMELQGKDVKALEDAYNEANGIIIDTALKGETEWAKFTKSVRQAEVAVSKIKAALKGLTDPNNIDDLQKWQDAFGKISTVASGAVGLLQAMSKEEGDAASSAANSIGAVMDIANATLQGLSQGGIIGGAVALVTSVATKIFIVEKAHNEALQQIADAKLATQDEYNKLLLKQNELLEKSKSIFGTDAYGEAKAYAQNYNKALLAYKNSTTALGSATVVTGSHKTGLFGWGGEKADYSNLLKQYPELIDAQGMLNKELAQSILNNQQLDETSRNALQTALDYSTEYEDALAQLSSYMEGIFGKLGNDMMDSLVANLGDAEAAMDDFSGYVAKTIEQLMEDIAYSLYLAPLFKKLSEDMIAITDDATLTDDEKAKRQQDRMAQFMIDAEVASDKTMDWMEMAQITAGKNGFKIWGKTDAESQGAASQGSFQTMSQDTGNALEGRFTSMQMTMVDMKSLLSGIAPDTAAIKLNTSITAETMANMKSIALESMNHLYDINKNTKELYAMRTLLEGIKKGTDQI